MFDFVSLVNSNKDFLVNFTTIAILCVITTLTFYLIFLLLGVGGISKNRKAQGLDKNSNPSFSLASVSSSLMGNGIDNKSGFRSLADIDVTSLQGAKDASKIVDKVIEQISVYRGEIGSFQKNALEANLHSLRVSKENLTASESILADTDMAQEMSSLVKNQILLSSGTAMLAQANQVPQSVLTLLNSNG